VNKIEMQIKIKEELYTAIIDHQAELHDSYSSLVLSIQFEIP